MAWPQLKQSELCDKGDIIELSEREYMWINEDERPCISESFSTRDLAEKWKQDHT